MGDALWLRVAVLIAVVAWSPLAGAQPSSDAAIAAPTLGGLCRVLRESASGASRCRIVRRAERDGVRAAALLVSDERHDELWLAVGEPRRWRVVRAAATAYSYQDARGAIELRSLEVRQSIPGGPPELDAAVSRWQATLDPPNACFARRVPELHRYVCALRDGEWSCLGVQVQGGGGETLVLERPCDPPPRTPPPAWSVALRFMPERLEVALETGAPPESMQPWMGHHALDEVLAPLGARAVIASPPDTI